MLAGIATLAGRALANNASNSRDPWQARARSSSRRGVFLVDKIDRGRAWPFDFNSLVQGTEESSDLPTPLPVPSSRLVAGDLNSPGDCCLPAHKKKQESDISDLSMPLRKLLVTDCRDQDAN